MPRFFTDECVASAIVAGLRAKGFDVLEAKDVCAGEADERALALAASDGRVLITDDRGIAELAVRKKQAAAGVVVILLHALPSRKREAYAVEQIAAHAESLENRISIIEPGRVRSRHLE
ncbi:MAG: DUF5615 family PIN-like protein [Rhodomicrobium sp.]